jgi:hypothetical protein
MVSGPRFMPPEKSQNPSGGSFEMKSCDPKGTLPPDNDGRMMVTGDESKHNDAIKNDQRDMERLGKIQQLNVRHIVLV